MERMTYKFRKTKLELIERRLSMITTLRIFKGPVLIQCMICRYQIAQELFALEFEQGRHTKIPNTLQ